jgi:hypothetical protein
MAMELTSVTIPTDGHPVVTMTVTERHGFGVKGIPVSGAVSTSAIDHMQTNGGQFRVPRSSVPANTQGEQCLVCHGPNRIAAIATVHTIKAP